MQKKKTLRIYQILLVGFLLVVTNVFANNQTNTQTQSFGVKRFTDNLSNKSHSKEAAHAALPKPEQVTSKGIRASRKGLSFNFQDIDTRSLLQLLAKSSGKNFVISDKVSGRMSLHLKNVSWREVLNIVLKANGLGSRKIGNTILVAPMTDLANNEIQELQAKQQVAQLAPLKSEIIRLKYANAKNIAELLKGPQGTLLSSRGQVGIEPRTNSLWVRDIASNLSEVRHFVQKLDIPAKQVMIEARIVSIDQNYGRDLGARFGITNGKHLTGTLSGANQLNGGPGAGGLMPLIQAGAAGVTPFTDRLNFNLPANSASRPGTIALGLLNIGGKMLLDMELSALESEGHAETISSPRLITSNQQEAIIQQGEEIPYQRATSSGATSVEFRKAVLSLGITPQITPDNNIILTLKVTENTRGPTIITGSEGFQTALPPTINTKEVQSQVFLKNGQTIVLGGIYQRSKQDNITRVPFFGRLPLIGVLFRNKQQSYRKTELLIFITPRIIK